MTAAVASAAMTFTPAARIARFLGVQAQADDRVSLAQCVAAGLPASSIDAVADRVDAQVLHVIVPEATSRRVRREGKPLSRETSEKLYEFGRIHELATRIYGGDDSAAMAFLQTPHVLLNGQTPLLLATSSSAGADAVEDLLNRADAGFAA